MKRCYKWLENRILCKHSFSVILTKWLLGAVMFSIVFSLTSFAWISRNEKSNANSLEMQTEVSKNLVMVTDEADISDTSKWVNSASWKTSDTIEAMLPTTRLADKTTEYAYTDLYYVTNPGSLSISTGLAKSGKTLTYERIENDPANLDPSTKQPLSTPQHIYYMDFEFYVAAEGDAIEKGTLAFAISSALSANTDSTDKVAYSHKAATVEVFFPDIDDTDGYKGKITVAEALNGGTITLTGVNIPLSSESEWLKVRLRLYFDGEFKDLNDSSKAYVNTKNVVIDGLTIGVSVTADI